MGTKDHEKMITSFHKSLILRHVGTLETRHVVSGRHRYIGRDGNGHDERITKKEKCRSTVNVCMVCFENNFYRCRYGRR